MEINNIVVRTMSKDTVDRINAMFDKVARDIQPGFSLHSDVDTLLKEAKADTKEA